MSKPSIDELAKASLFKVPRELFKNVLRETQFVMNALRDGLVYRCELTDDYLEFRCPGQKTSQLQVMVVNEFNYQDPAPKHPAKDGLAPASPPRSGFPRVWELFPIILPRSARTRVYEPSHEELREDYLKEKARWRTKWAKRWVTFAFTVRTLGLIGRSLWAAAGGATRKVLAGVVALIVGERVVSAFREKIAEWIGRLP